MRVLVLGAGYAGLLVARKLEGALPGDAELVVVNDTPHHLVQHELHRVVRRPGLRETLRVPLADVFDRATVREARVEAVDPDAREVALADGETIPYDACAVCLGATTDYHGLPGVEEHGRPLKRVRDALAVREAFLSAVAGEPDGRVVVGGAGLSGVQVAGELAALADERDAAADVLLLEQEDSVAPGFPGPLQSAVRERLVAAGVDVRTGAQVERATADAVHATGERLPCDQFVWTGGITGTAALGGERPLVRADLALDGDPRTVVVGDAARVVDRDGAAVPASAQAAVREVGVAVTTLRRGLGLTTDRRQFAFDAPGWVVSVGDDVVAQVGPAVVTGAPARAMKSSVALGYLSEAGAVRQALGVAYDELYGADD